MVNGDPPLPLVNPSSVNPSVPAMAPPPGIRPLYQSQYPGPSVWPQGPILPPAPPSIYRPRVSRHPILPMKGIIPTPQPPCPVPARSFVAMVTQTPGHVPPATSNDPPPVTYRFSDGHGWVTPPDPDELTEKVSQAGLMTLNKPTSLTGKSWICRCKVEYAPSSNLFADIQHPRCLHCQTENGTSYSWTLTKVILDGVELNPSIVYLQQPGDHFCTAYAILGVCNMLRMLRGAQMGWYEPTNLSLSGFVSAYQAMHGYQLLREPDRYNWSLGRIENLLTVAYRKGIPYVRTSFDDTHIELRGSLKIKFWFRVGVTEVDKITRLIAHGYPLIGIVPMGVLFKYVKARQIYHAPEVSNVKVTHAVVLHGSGYTAPIGTYYKARNSAGPHGHPDYELKDFGADFDVWASDLVSFVYGLALA